jgi:hypothetical protein
MFMSVITFAAETTVLSEEIVATSLLIASATSSQLREEVAKRSQPSRISVSTKS